MNVYKHHISKVQDAITVLTSRGQGHYRTDIARFTGLKQGQVDAVLEILEAEARVDPTAQRRTIPWTLHAGDKGGIAVTKDDRSEAMRQRDQSLDTQLERHFGRVKAEFERHPYDTVRAMRYAKAARRLGPVKLDQVKDDIFSRHLEDLLSRGTAPAKAATANTRLRRQVEAL